MSFFSMQNKLVAIPLKYGIIGGCIIILQFTVLYLFDKNPLLSIEVKEGLVLSSVVVLILIIFIFFSLKEFKEKYNNYLLHFWQGMIGGILTYLTISLMSAIFIFILTVIIEPELTTKFIEGRILYLTENKELLMNKWGDERYLLALQEVKETTGLDLALDDFLKKSIIGLFLTIIIAVILRK